MEEVIINMLGAILPDMKPEYGIPQASKTDSDNMGFADVETDGTIYEIKSINKHDVAVEEAAHYVRIANREKGGFPAVAGTEFRVGNEIFSGLSLVRKVEQSEFPVDFQGLFPMGALWYVKWQSHGDGAITYEWYVAKIEPPRPRPSMATGTGLLPTPTGFTPSLTPSSATLVAPVATLQSVGIEETAESKGQLDNVLSEIREMLAKYPGIEFETRSSTQVDGGSGLEISAPAHIDEIHAELERRFGLDYCITVIG